MVTTCGSARKIICFVAPRFTPITSAEKGIMNDNSNASVPKMPGLFIAIPIIKMNPHAGIKVPSEMQRNIINTTFPPVVSKIDPDGVTGVTDSTLGF